MPSCETPARPRPPYVRWCPARAKRPPARLPVMHLWVAIARLAVGHPARPRLGKPGRERCELTGVAWRRRCRALTGCRRRPQERQRRGRSARPAPVAQRTGHYAADDLAAAARRGRLLPPQLSTGAVGRPGLWPRADRHRDLSDAGGPVQARRPAPGRIGVLATTVSNGVNRCE